MEKLQETLHETWHFYRRTLVLVAKGSRLYYAWCFSLMVIIAAGFFFYLKQHEVGLIATHMTDQVSWGLYIANFTYLVGAAAAAVLLVIPSYVYHFKPIKEIVVLGELFAASSIVMAILFVMVDLGRLDRFWHMIPFIGLMNFPQSLLAWDVLALNGYLFLNLLIPIYLLVKFYYRKEPNWKFILPFILLSIPMAVAIHTVTAFLYNGLPARPFWNASILAPRFLASAFCSGPAIIIIIFQIIRKVSTSRIEIEDEALFKISELIAYAMFLNLFLLFAEIFKEYYSQTVHIASFKYLFEGLHGHKQLVPWIWTAMTMNVIAFIIFLIPHTRKRLATLNLGCLLVIIGVWIEKGPGFVIPGFVPDPLGEIFEYMPNLLELIVSFGIWATGLLIFTLLMKVAIPIETGKFTHTEYKREAIPPRPY
ncbi:MAG TPA: NrfD/PsrC family molybdoenzyme membrane anchor subunit [Thermodesulfobacteriota bacterium]|nr:NrfD/PsrC family molybdoenzyme membrane anchor subunit [Thermodesulfobacteriota bacterium]